MTFQEACQAILDDPKANPYAKAYAKRGLTLTGAKIINFQARYILSNLTYWRTPKAKEVKAALRQIVEAK